MLMSASNPDPIQAIHHVQVTTPSDRLEAMVAFYRDVLALPPTPRPAFQSPGAWFRVFDRDLHIGVDTVTDRSANRSHIAYKVANLDTMRTRLESLGLATHSAPAMDGYDRLYVHDPAGNLVELIQPSRVQLDVDRTPWPKVHLSVALMHNEKLLLVREGKPQSRDKWNLPGGHAERGEFAIEGALRELREETDVAGTATAILGVFSSLKALRVIVLATAIDPKPIDGDEVLESRFWSLDDAERLADDDLMKAPHMREVFARLRTGISYPLDLIAAISGS